MNLKEYAKMADFEKNYWWHRGKIHLVQSLIEKYFPGRTNLQILEVGCGTGKVTKFLQNYGKVVGIDMSSEAVLLCQQNGINNVFQMDLLDINTNTFGNQFDLILALDVLEHIQNDLDAMKCVKAVLTKGGFFLVNVPAHKFLWSEHDEALHHKRRYHSLEITKKLQDAGFVIVQKSHFVALAFPIIAFYRIWGNFFGKSAYPKTSYVKIPEFLNDFMAKILFYESQFIRFFNLPIGTTISVVAK